MDNLTNSATIATNSVLPYKGRAARPHYLEQTEGDGGVRLFKLSDKELIIGRAEDANVRLISPKASRHHAILTRIGAEYVIRDNNSRNGVYLNGLKIFSAIIRDGDLIQVADSEFGYREG